MLVAAAFVLQARTFDLRFDAAPVSRVIATISRESGTSLSVDEAVGKEIVALRLPRTTASAAMDRLAEGLHAAWKTKDGRPVLTRTDDMIADERRDFEELRRKALRRGLASKSLPPFDAGRYEQASALLREARQGKALDPVLLKQAEETEYTQSPQARLVARLRAAFSPEFAIALGDGRVVFHSRPNPRQRPLTPALNNALRLYREEDDSDLRADGLEVVVDGSWGDPIVRYRFLDREGNPLGGGYAESLRGDYAFATVLLPRMGNKLLRPGMGWGLPENTEGRIPEAVRRRILDVASHDPLAPVGDWLARCAQARGEGLVAVLGDDALAWLPYGSTEPGEFLSGLAAKGYATRERDGLLTVVPLDRRAARARQADRDVLKAWLDVERGGQHLTIADKFRLTRRLPLAAESRGLTDWLQSVGVEDPVWNTPLLRIAAASPRNRTVRLGDLPGGAREALRTMVQNSGAVNCRVRLGGLCGTGWDVAPDVTDELPFFVSDDAPVRLDEIRLPCLVYDVPARGLFVYPSRKTVEDIDGDDLSLSDWIPVRVGVCHRIDLTVGLGGGRTYQDRIEAIERLGPPIPVANLPEPLLSAARRAAAREKKRDEETPPPPPGGP